MRIEVTVGSNMRLRHGERFNTITHLIGLTAALAGLVVLVALAARKGDPWRIVSFSVYGVTLVALYGFSALHHAHGARPDSLLQRFDHYAIYLLIAGTYTPFTLVTLRGVWGWTLFWVIWGLAVVGIVIDSLPNRGRRILPLIIYLLMGWLCLAALAPLLRALPTAGFAWLLAGGLFYTVGLVFFIFDERVRHFHGIWHLFVLAGSVSHYVSIILYVL